MLRQAARNLEAGKFVAAEQLYRQIIDETPRNLSAWLGLAEATQDMAQKEAAYEQALALDPDNDKAQVGLAHIRGEGPAPDSSEIVLDTPAQVEKHVDEAVEEGRSSLNTSETRPSTGGVDRLLDEERNSETAVNHDHGQVTAVSEDVELFCYRHPNRSTSLRCYKCNKPICSECTNKTPVGYLCPDCYRAAEDAFFNAKPTDYLLALLVALPLSLIAGWLVVRFSGGIFMILLFVFAGGAMGGFISRLAKRVMGNRRGRYIPHLIAACIVVGVLIWAWPWLLVLLSGAAGVLLKLAGIGVYLFTAASSAFYWAR